MKKIKIKKLMWDITWNCNLNCSHCYNKKNIKNSKNIFIDLKESFNYLNKIEYKSILIQGGEPLLVENLFDIIGKLKQQNKKVYLTTNAILLDFCKIKKLLESNIDGIYFSIESADEKINDEIRGKGSFKKAIKNIQNFMYLYKEKLNKNVIDKLFISVTTTLSNKKEYTLYEIENIFKMIEKLNIDNISFLPIIEEKDLFMDEQKRSRINFINGKKIAKINLIYPKIKVTYPIMIKTYLRLKTIFKEKINFLGIKTECPAGDKIAYIDPEFKLRPCPFLLRIDLNTYVLDLKQTRLSYESYNKFFLLKNQSKEFYIECLKCKLNKLKVCHSICPSGYILLKNKKNKYNCTL